MVSIPAEKGRKSAANLGQQASKFQCGEHMGQSRILCGLQRRQQFCGMCLSRLLWCVSAWRVALAAGLRSLAPAPTFSRSFVRYHDDIHPHGRVLHVSRRGSERVSLWFSSCFRSVFIRGSSWDCLGTPPRADDIRVKCAVAGAAFIPWGSLRHDYVSSMPTVVIRGFHRPCGWEDLEGRDMGRVLYICHWKWRLLVAHVPRITFLVCFSWLLSHYQGSCLD